jgi:hypothetical protein
VACLGYFLEGLFEAKPDGARLQGVIWSAPVAIGAPNAKRLPTSS